MTTSEERFKAAARKRMQRSVPAERCSRCGETQGKLERHHPDIMARPDEVIVLCSKCHMEHHPRRVPPAVCIECGSTFQPKRRRRSRICSPECQRELNRRVAHKRWDARQA